MPYYSLISRNIVSIIISAISSDTIPSASLFILYTWKHPAQRLLSICPRVWFTSRFYVSRGLVNFRWSARMCWPLALPVTRSRLWQKIVRKFWKSFVKFLKKWLDGSAVCDLPHRHIILRVKGNKAERLQHGSSTANIHICLRIW